MSKIKWIFLGVFVASLAFSMQKNPEAGASKPNIVFIMADDLGLGDVSYYTESVRKKSPVVRTPHIDALAAQGMWFSDAHSSTSLCSPTRYCVMSGNMNFRGYEGSHWGVWGTFRRNAVDPGQATLGTVARAAGYATGFVGKWHLGGDFINSKTGKIYRGDDHKNPDAPVDLTQMVGGGPVQLGFDYSYMLPCGIQGPIYVAYENNVWAPFAKDSEIIYLDETTAKNPRIVSDKGAGLGDSNWDTAGMGQRLSAKAVDFINDTAGEKPFFLCYWSPTVHIPHIPPVEFDGVKIKGTTPTPHMDMIRDLDLQVARIIQALKENDVYDNTLIVFTSDNGGLPQNDSIKVGHNPNGGWRGHKNAPHEGGHRVPFFAVWHGLIAEGTVCDEPIINHDMLATMAALLKVNVPEDEAMDSLNLLPLLTGQEGFEQRDYLIQQSGCFTEAMFRDGDWKLIMKSDYQSSKFDPVALFNLANQPSEKEESNLIDHPEQKRRVEAMRAKYLEIRNGNRRTTPVIAFGEK